jgi:hypothetical protein
MHGLYCICTYALRSYSRPSDLNPLLFQVAAMMVSVGLQEYVDSIANIRDIVESKAKAKAEAEAEAEAKAKHMHARTHIR